MSKVPVKFQDCVNGPEHFYGIQNHSEHQIKITISIDTMSNFDGDLHRHIDVYIFNINMQYTLQVLTGSVARSSSGGGRSTRQARINSRTNPTSSAMNTDMITPSPYDCYKQTETIGMIILMSEF